MSIIRLITLSLFIFTQTHADTIYNLIKIPNLGIYDIKTPNKLRYLYAKKPFTLGVEKNIKCVKHISLTINELNITSKIIKQDVFKFLSNCTTNFDIIFADPPYSFDDDHYNKLINLIDSKFLNDSSSLFILEHYKKKGFHGVKNFVDERNYGDCSFTFFQQKSG